MIQRNATIIYSGFFIGMDSCRLSGGNRAQIPARKVLRGGSGQKKVSFPARNGMPTACRAGKHLNSCAEGAPETSGAYVHIEVRFVDARMQSV